MSTSPSFIALVTAALLGITAGSAWSAEATPNTSTAATRPQAPVSGVAQGWYPPYPRHGGYPQHWQQPAQQSVQPQHHAAQPHHYPPRVPYQAATSAAAKETAAADNPPGAEPGKVRKQLAASNEKLKKARASLAKSQASLKQSRKKTKALEKQVSDATAKTQDLQARETELTRELKASVATLAQHRKQLTSDQQMIRTLIADRARLRNHVANLDSRLARLLADLQSSSEALQQAQAEPATCNQQLSDAMAQSAAFRNELGELKTRLQNQEATLADTEQQLATANGERDGLEAVLAECNQELARTRAALKTSRSGTDSQRPASAASAAADRKPAQVTAEVVEQDTDGDGVPDIIDLCPASGQGTAVESTGCAAGATISLDGVDFLNDSQQLTEAAKRVLGRLAAILNQHPDLRLEVAAHTRATGNPSHDKWLSLERAETVMDYLVAQGVNPDRIGATGYGGQQPVSGDMAGEGMQANQRVELRPLQ